MFYASQTGTRNTAKESSPNHAREEPCRRTKAPRETTATKTKETATTTATSRAPVFGRLMEAGFSSGAVQAEQQQQQQRTRNLRTMLAEGGAA